MLEERRVHSYLAAAALIVSLAACGGSSSGPTPVPTPTPPPTPPPPQVVAQGTGLSLAVDFVGRVPITTTRAGSLEATVDWTFAANDIDVALVRTNCSFDQFVASQCQVLAISASTTAKPERIRADGLAAGDYTLFIENTGPGDETLSYQVVLTASATAAASSRGAPGLPLELKHRPRGFVDLR